LTANNLNNWRETWRILSFEGKIEEGESIVKINSPSPVIVIRVLIVIRDFFLY